MGCSFFGVLEFRSFGILESWGFGVLEYWSFGVLEFWSFGVLEFWSIEVLEFWNFSVFPIKKITDNHYKTLPKNFLVLFFCLFFVVDWRINRYIGCNFFGDTRDHMEH